MSPSNVRAVRGAVAPVGERLPKSDRILRRGEYLRIQNRGRKMHTEGFLVFALPSSQPRTRVGITASKKVGSAVQRNRVKRLVREVFRRNRASLPVERWDVVFVAKQRAAGMSYAEVLEQFRTACKLLARPVSASGGAGTGSGARPARPGAAR